MTTPRFNGATSFQTWKRNSRAAYSGGRSGFNGATSFQTWKPWLARLLSGVFTLLQWGHVFSDVETNDFDYQIISDNRLQWGHVFSDVETSLPTRPLPRLPSASMGPRLFRRGNQCRIWHHKQKVESFNGATSFQTWKRLSRRR